MRGIKMEIKTSIDIAKEGYCQEGDNISKYARKTWIAVDEIIKELDKTWNRINKYNIDRHPNYISKTQVAVFLRDLKNAITSDSKSSYEDSLNKGYEVNQK